MLLICWLRLPLVTAAKVQNVQLYGFSPVWDLTCLLICAGLFIIFEQIGQAHCWEPSFIGANWNENIFVLRITETKHIWIYKCLFLIWVFKLSLRLKDSGQYLQTNGFSSEWTFIWVNKLHFCEQVKSHKSHA